MFSKELFVFNNFTILKIAFMIVAVCVHCATVYITRIDIG